MDASESQKSQLFNLDEDDEDITENNEVLQNYTEPTTSQMSKKR